MFEHLRIRKIKGLSQCDLLNLGRINVICGKNNSGKSTLLEGINNASTRTMGTTLVAASIQSIFDAGAASMGWSSSGPQRQEYRRYRELLNGVTSTRDVWFEDDPFESKVEDTYRSDPYFRQWRFIGGALTNAYANLFKQKYNTILLPPKRQMELNADVNSQQPISSDGLGLLNYLFRAKNQNEDANDFNVCTDIADAFTTISSGYNFDIFLGDNNQLNLNFHQPGASWIPAGDCGLGLQDLLILLYFAVHPGNDVMLIEEPESHLHPDMQRKLLNFLRNGTSKQYFISTHSNVFLNNTFVDRVYFTSFTDQVVVDDATKLASILDDIGYSVADNLVSDLVVLVEGPRDVPIIEEYFNKMGLYNDYNIKIWPLGGDNMGQLDLSVFRERYSVIALVDNDPGSTAIRKKFIGNCRQYNIPVSQLKRYSIENYFSLRVLREVFGASIRESITEIDPNQKTEAQIGFSIKGNNKTLAEKMTLDEIKDTDDLYKFLLKAKKICES